MDVGKKGGGRKPKGSLSGNSGGGGAAACQDPPGGGAPRPVPVHALQSGPERSARRPPPSLSCHEPWPAEGPSRAPIGPQQLTSMVLGVGMAPQTPSKPCCPAPRPSCGKLRALVESTFECTRDTELLGLAVCVCCAVEPAARASEMGGATLSNRPSPSLAHSPHPRPSFQRPRGAQCRPASSREQRSTMKRLSGLQASFLETGAL